MLDSANHASSGENQSARDSENLALKNSLKPASIAKPSTLALQNGGTGEEDIKESDQVPEPLSENDRDQEVISLW